MALAVLVVIGTGGCATTAPAPGGATRDDARPTVYDLRSGATLHPDEAAAWLIGHRQVYVAERHTDPASHTAQLDVLRRMRRAGRSLAVAIEWLPAEAQPALDGYLTGDLDERALQEAVDWEGTWGHPFHHYAPILRFARDARLPVWALDAPRGLARQVGRGGIEGLSAADRARLPPLDTANDAHRAWFGELMSALAHDHAGAEGHGPIDPDKLGRYYLAQLVRDELMARHLADHLARSPDALTAVVLAGRGHIVYGHGVPLRVEALTDAGFAIVLPEAAADVSEPPAASPEPYPGRPGDLLWVVGRPEPTRAAGVTHRRSAGGSAGPGPGAR